jgi:MraZ protein
MGEGGSLAQDGSKCDWAPGMLLTGTHIRALDDKKRLVLPKRVREQLGEPETMFVAPGPDQCLWLYTQTGLEQFAGKLDQAPATDAEARVFRRLYFAQTEAVDLDRSGRMLIPERLLQFAALRHDVILIGVRDHLELWDAKRWQRYLSDHASRFDSVAEGAMHKR